MVRKALMGMWVRGIEAGGDVAVEFSPGSRSSTGGGKNSTVKGDGGSGRYAKIHRTHGRHCGLVVGLRGKEVALGAELDSGQGRR